MPQLSSLSKEVLGIAAYRISMLKAVDPWRNTARPNQLQPPGEWRTWFIKAGRGFGKTRTAAEWIREELTMGGKRRAALVGATGADTRDVMVEGESGLLACCERYAINAKYQPSRRRVIFPNGARAMMYSADEPERLRGPQHDCGWGDEIASWRYPAAYDNLDMGLRLGSKPRMVVTGTPKPVPLVKALTARSKMPNSDVVVTGGSLFENEANLAPSFVESMERRYAGSRLGRQELEGELLEDVEGALWTLSLIDECRVTELPTDLDFKVMVVAIDPSVSNTPGSNETGIIVFALGSDGDGYVLDDASLAGSPHEWAVAAVDAYDHWEADRIVPEANNGGDLVKVNLQTIRKDLPIKPVHASRGKVTRAEPVATLYEQHRIHHVGIFAALEDQMATWVPGMPSPDRMDALVWGATDTMLGSIRKWEDNANAALLSRFLGRG